MAKKNRRDNRAALKFFKNFRKRLQSNFDLWKTKFEDLIGSPDAPKADRDSAFQRNKKSAGGGWATQEGHAGKASEAKAWFKTFVGNALAYSGNLPAEIAKKSREKPGFPQANINENYQPWDNTYNINVTRDTSQRPGFGDGKTDAQRRQFSPLAKNLGGYILRIGSKDARLNMIAREAVKGTHIPDNLLSEKDVMDEFRAKLGIEESGASRLKALTGTIKNSFGKAYGYAQMANLSQQGGMGGAIGGGALIMNGMSDAESAVTSPMIRELVPAITKRIFNSPEFGVKLINSMGRVLRLGGAAAVIAQVGIAAYAQQVKTERSANLSIAGKRKLMEDTSLEQDAREISSDVDRTYAAKNKYSLQGVTDALGFTEGETEKSGRVAQRLAAREFLAANPHLTGGNMSEALARYAAKKGLRVGDLTNRERGQAIKDANFKLPLSASDRGHVSRLAEENSADWIKKLTGYETDNYQARRQEEEQRLTDELATGTGEFYGSGLGPVEKMRRQEFLYKKHIENLPSTVRMQAELVIERKAALAQAEGARRKVQNFD